MEIASIPYETDYHYDHAVDLRLEKLVMKKYGLTEQECQLIAAEMDRLPNLSAVINMKMEV